MWPTTERSSLSGLWPIVQPIEGRETSILVVLKNPSKSRCNLTLQEKEMELASEREKARRDVEELGKKVQVNTLDYVQFCLKRIDFVTFLSP